MGILDRLKKKPEATQEQDSQSVNAVEKPKAKANAKVLDKPVEKSTEKPALSTKQIQRTQATQIIISPVVTEKSTMTGTYYFKISATANRNEVHKAFTTLYGKSPRKVNITNVKGKKKRFGAIRGKRANWKKAIVYLKQGETIDVFTE